MSEREARNCFELTTPSKTKQDLSLIHISAGSATGTGSGLGSVIGGAMFGSSMASGGKFANEVVGAVATGNIASVGSIKGEQAAQALTRCV